MDVLTVVIAVVVGVIVFSVLFTLPIIIASHGKRRQSGKPVTGPAELEAPGNRNQSHPAQG